MYVEVCHNHRSLHRVSGIHSELAWSFSTLGLLCIMNQYVVHAMSHTEDTGKLHVLHLNREPNTTLLLNQPLLLVLAALILHFNMV